MYVALDLKIIREHDRLNILDDPDDLVTRGHHYGMIAKIGAIALGGSVKTCNAFLYSFLMRLIFHTVLHSVALFSFILPQGDEIYKTYMKFSVPIAFFFYVQNAQKTIV